MGVKVTNIHVKLKLQMSIVKVNKQPARMLDNPNVTTEGYRMACRYNAVQRYKMIDAWPDLYFIAPANPTYREILG